MLSSRVLSEAIKCSLRILALGLCRERYPDWPADLGLLNWNSANNEVKIMTYALPGVCHCTNAQYRLNAHSHACACA